LTIDWSPAAGFGAAAAGTLGLRRLGRFGLRGRRKFDVSQFQEPLAK
jgi:hypothetical protein